MGCEVGVHRISELTCYLWWTYFLNVNRNSTEWAWWNNRGKMYCLSIGFSILCRYPRAAGGADTELRCSISALGAKPFWLLKRKDMTNLSLGVKHFLELSLNKFWNSWTGNKLIMGFYNMHFPYKALKYNVGLLPIFWLFWWKCYVSLLLALLYVCEECAPFRSEACHLLLVVHERTGPTPDQQRPAHSSSWLPFVCTGELFPLARAPDA